MIVTSCKWCKISFRTYPSRLKRGDIFCSSKCYGLSQRGKKLSPEHIEKVKRGLDKIRKPPNKTCSRCKKPIRVFPYLLKRNKKFFCKWECRKNPPKPKKPRKKHVYPHKDFIVKNGYKFILLPNHPRANSKGYVREHIVILEKKLRRKFYPGEVSHHIDGDKMNNSPGNLTTFPNNKLHIKFHSALSNHRPI